MVETGTTELARPIPGLETVEPVQPAPERPWAQAGSAGSSCSSPGRSNPDLAAKIAEHLGIDLGDVELKTFANGEMYCRRTASRSAAPTCSSCSRARRP